MLGAAIESHFQAGGDGWDLQLTVKLDKLYTIRAVKNGDEDGLVKYGLEGLSDKSRSVYEPYKWMADDLKEQFQESIANSLSKKDLHCVILDEDTIIGHFFLWSAQDEIPELAIAVADSHHSRGIGNALLLYFEIVGKF